MHPGLWQQFDGPAGVALGGAPLGNLYTAVSDEQAERTLERAWALGMRGYDTAPHYGQGLSEQRLGRFLQTRPRAQFVLSTKVGRLLRADAAATADQHGYVQALRCTSVYDYSAEGALRSIADSLERLGLDRIDVAYIHDIDRRTHGAAQPRRYAEAMGGAYRALERLRGEGVLRAIGLGVNDWEVCRDAMADGDFDAFMLAGRYTLLDRSAAGELIPACETRGVRLVIAGAYNSGVLATGGVPGARYDYREAPPEVLERVRRIEAVCSRFGVPLRAAALQFARHTPCVAGVVVGARSQAEVEDAVRMARHPIPPALWAAIDTARAVPPATPP
jgi:D-threo-aldose 1-dehydrogenase